MDPTIDCRPEPDYLAAIPAHKLTEKRWAERTFIVELANPEE